MGEREEMDDGITGAFPYASLIMELVHTHMHTHIQTCTHILTHMHTHIQTYTHIYTLGRVKFRVHVCICLCV